MLEKVGIKMTIRPSERVAWVQKTLAGDFEMGTLLSGVRPDPDLVLAYRFAKDGPGNYMGVNNPELEKLFADGRTTYDVPKRQELYEKAQNIIADESYLCFIWRRQGVIAMQKALQGYTPPWTQAITMSTEFYLDKKCRKPSPADPLSRARERGNPRAAQAPPHDDGEGLFR